MTTRFRFNASVIVAALMAVSAAHAQAMSKAEYKADDMVTAATCDAKVGGANTRCTSTAKTRFGLH
jgi:hypothetical protein